ncbi:unnamed protein product [Aphis gossypii]|uniref:Uncharacterized protein n=1 Tax=Aphis gossypii TaxID=80765 RepID=A0A9P0NQY7_APHGO|nr:unnamed protein product [Aphis gossypii]
MSEPNLKTSCASINRNVSKSLPGLDLMANYVVKSPLKRYSVSMPNIPIMISESSSNPVVSTRGLVEIDTKNDDSDGTLRKIQTPTPNIVGTTSGAVDHEEPAAWLVFTKPNRPNTHKVTINKNINGQTTKNIIFPDDTETVCGIEVKIPVTSAVQAEPQELKTVARYVMYGRPFTRDMPLTPNFVVRRPEAMSSLTDNRKRKSLWYQTKQFVRRMLCCA